MNKFVSNYFILTLVIIFSFSANAGSPKKEEDKKLFTYQLPKNYSQHIEKDWDFIFENDGIKVYSSKNNNQGPMAFRGQGKLKVSTLKILATLINLEKSPVWTPNLILKKMLKQYSITDAIIYNYNDLPWPASNRDSIIRSKLVIDKNNKALNIISRSVPYDYKSPDDGRVRGILYSSNFVIKPISDVEIFADLEAHFDAKGLLPNFLVNFFQKDWPYKFLKNLEAQAKKNEIPVTKELHEAYQKIIKELNQL